MTQIRKNKTKDKPIERKTILVIEDERSLLEIVDSRLKNKGFDVMTARSVDEVFNAGIEAKGMGIIAVKSIQQALDYLEDLEKVDAIWLDHNLLGKENGFDLIKKIKANGGRWKNVPIFVISNSEKSETINTYIELGINKYYIKSNHKLDDIIGDIHKHLDAKVNKRKS
ncbi:MAG: response regulator [Candidatus Pacebacteria bacterium]|nr:response regulator [Candidatus Paceibacterota bacterium]